MPERNKLRFLEKIACQLGRRGLRSNEGRENEDIIIRDANFRDLEKEIIEILRFLNNKKRKSIFSFKYHL